MKITLDIPDNTDQAALVVILREAADYLNNEEDPVELMDSTIRIPSIHGAVFLDPQPDIEPIEPPAPKKMNLHIPACILMAGRYATLDRGSDEGLIRLVYSLHHEVAGVAMGVFPEPNERLQRLWEVEEKMPPDLRDLLMRELCHSASEYDKNNGNCLDPDAYEWCQSHASAKERARALAATYLIAMLKRLYIGGVNHPALDQLREEFKIAAAEEGADREIDFDAELWEESHFEELFRPLEGVEL